MWTDDRSWAPVRSRNCSRPRPHDPGVGRGDVGGGERVVYRPVAAAASGERGIGRIAEPLAVRAQLEVSRFVLEAVQRLPLHRELNLRRIPDSSDRLEGEPQPAPASAMGQAGNYAAARLRYAAASAIALSKCAAVAGVAAVRPGPRRTSNKYAAAVSLVKRRSPAWAGTARRVPRQLNGVSVCLGSQGVAADRDHHRERKEPRPWKSRESSSRGLEKPGAAVVY
jgi:hypothetical protein